MTRHRALTALVASVAIPVLLAACGGGSSIPTVPPATPTAATTPAPSAAPSTAASGAPSAAASAAAGAAYPAGCPTAQPEALKAGETRTITMNTPKGDIVLTIKADLSPIAAGNFVALSQCGYYDGVVFHRLVPGFVIQGGDGEFGRVPNVDKTRVGTGGPPYTIKDEAVTGTYKRAVLAMARTSQPDSVGSQFFIILTDQAQAPLASVNTYQIIGEVTTGMDVVDAIAAMPNDGSEMNLAVDPVPMTKVTVATP